MIRPDYTINKFRARRGLLLRQQINDLADHLGRDIVILDVGGRADYWANIGFDRIARIDVVNYDERAVKRPIPDGMPAGIFTGKVGMRATSSSMPTSRLIWCIRTRSSSMSAAGRTCGAWPPS